VITLSSNNSMQRTALRDAADADRQVGEEVPSMKENVVAIERRGILELGVRLSTDRLPTAIWLAEHGGHR